MYIYTRVYKVDTIHIYIILFPFAVWKRTAVNSNNIITFMTRRRVPPRFKDITFCSCSWRKKNELCAIFNIVC